MRFPEGQPMPAIISIGMATGGRLVTNEHMDRILERKPGLTERLMSKVGIKHRYYVTDGQTSSDLAATALLEAIINGDIDPSKIGSLFIANSSPDRLGVTTVADVQDKLNLPNWIEASTNSDACAGFLHALKSGYSYLNESSSDEDFCAVIGVEVLSLSIGRDNEYSHPKRRKEAMTVLLGDGAGAVILDKVIPDEWANTKVGFAFGLDGRYADDLGIEAGGSKFPLTVEALQQGRNLLAMDGKLVFEHAIPRMAEATRRALIDADMPIEEIDWLIPHQANRQIIEGVAEELGVSMEKVIVTIGEYGNTSSASIPMALYNAVKEGKIYRNQNVAMAAFGAGFSFGAAVIPMVGLPE